jgi:hypothetical protein
LHGFLLESFVSLDRLDLQERVLPIFHIHYYVEGEAFLSSKDV